VRKDFPILEQQVRGKPLVYLDSAATSQKPRAVIEAIARYYQEDNANVHRGVHLLSERATQAYEAAREKTQRFIHAAHAHEIVFVRGTTEAINLVSQAYGRTRVGAGDEVLVTVMEHHSNIVPWQLLCEEKGAILRVAPMDDEGQLLLDELEGLIGPRTKLLALGHVSNALGTINPSAPSRRWRTGGTCRCSSTAPGGAASRGRRAGAGLRLLRLLRPQAVRPTGIGVLYGKSDLLEQMPPGRAGAT